ncbi:hypothetical protein DMB90_05820 [Raoultella planticola]|uniref:Uncharacterized protein n=1 Tax=Raoultella planticola TaxID=575 RepID=A0A5P6A9B8_RAOPL|nr:hypothetical protein DMB90_05820 [Raoultella planticola]
MTRPLRSNILIFIAVFASERDKTRLIARKQTIIIRITFTKDDTFVLCVVAYRSTGLRQLRIMS